MFIMPLVYLFSILLLLYGSTIASNPECFSTQTENISCYSCSWDRYAPDLLIDSKKISLALSDCKPKDILQNNIRKVLVIKETCSNCAGFSAIYPTIVSALIAENKRALAFYSSDLTLYLHGTSQHIIMPSDFSDPADPQLLRRVRMRITITPLFCSEYSMIGCLQPTEKASIKLKTISFEIFISNYMMIKSVYFDGLGSHLSDTSNLDCVNSNTLSCCTESQIIQTFGTSNCALGSKIIYASDSNLEGKKSFLALEMIIDDPNAAIPELYLDDCKFENFFAMKQNFEALSFIRVDEFPAKVHMNKVRFRNFYFLNGFIKYQTNLARYDDFYEFSNYDVISSKLTAANFTTSLVEITALEMIYYNPTNIKTEGEGGKSLFELSLWKGKVAIYNFNISNYVSNHVLQFLFSFSTSPEIIINSLNGYNILNISFMKCEESNVILSSINIDTYLFNKINSFDFYSSIVFADHIAFINAQGPNDSKFSFIYGELTSLNISYSNFLNWINIAINLNGGGNLGIINTMFINATFKYALIANNMGEVYLGFSDFINITGAFFVIEVKKKNFTMEYSNGIRFKCQAAVNIDDCYNQNFSHCSFSQMSGLETFWTSSRLFKKKNVYNTTFSDSTMKVLISFYIGNTLDPAIVFDQVKMKNIIVTEYFLEFCCTNFSMINSKVENFLFEPITGRCFGVFEVYSHYFFINSTFQDVGWEIYPEAIPLLTRNFYRSLIFLWFANSITLKDIKYIATKPISLPTGIIAIGSFDGWVSISGLIMILKQTTQITPVRALLISYAVHITFENSVIKNTACPSLSKQLTFFHYNGVVGFYNFPQYGGEKSNKKWIKFVNNTFENCSCNSGGALTIINYNYIELRDCSFLNSKSEQDGGHFFIISSNSLNISNVNLTNSSASSGGGIFLSQIVSLIFEDCTLEEVKGRGSGAGYFYRVENSIIKNSVFRNFKMGGNGGAFFIDESNMKFERIIILNTEANLGGIFFVSFGSSIVIQFLNASTTTASSGGIIFVDETKDFFIIDSNFSNIVTSGLSSGFHVKAYSSLYIKNVQLKDASTQQKGTIFLKTLQTDAPSLIEDLTCYSTKADAGTCILYEGAAKLIINKLLIKMNEGKSAIEFNQPSLILTSIKEIVINLSTFDNFIIGGMLELSIINFYFSNSVLRSSGIDAVSSKLNLLNGTFKEINKGIAGKIVFWFNLWAVTFAANDLKIENVDLSKKNVMCLMNLAGSGSSNIKNIFISQFEESLGPLLLIDSGDHIFSNFKLKNNNVELLNCADSNITLIDITIENSDALIEINSKSSTTNNFLLIEKAFVNKKKGRLLKCEGLRNLTVNKAVYEGLSDNLPLGAVEVAGLYIFDTEIINIYASTFKKLKSESAPAFSLELNEFSSIFMKVNVKNSTFSNCESYLGGVFLSKGDLSITLENNIFTNNTSKFKKDQPRVTGIGGVGVIMRKSNNIVFLLGNKFESNKAENYASTIFCEGELNDIKDNTYTANTDSQGLVTKSISYPIKVKILKNVVNSTERESPDTTKINMTSGQPFNLTCFLEDAYGESLVYDSISVASVIEDLDDANKNSITITTNAEKALKGVFNFKNLIIKVLPNTTFKATLSIKLFEERNAASEEEIPKTFQTMKQSLTFFARPCLIGEIKLIDYSCYECPFSFYSLINPMSSEYSKIIQRCQSCPENAECQGNLITPSSGYWRQSAKSTLILRCTNQKACLGKVYSWDKLTVDEKITGVCAHGHFGNLCNDCDYGYGKFSKGGLCQNCNDDKVLIALRTTFIILLVVGYIVANVQIFTRLNKNKEAGASFPSLVAKILVSHFHQIGIVTFMENIFVLPSLENFIDIQNYLSFLSQDFLSIECIMQNAYYNKETTYIYKVLASIILPIAISLMAACFWFLLILFLFFLKNRNNLTYENTVRKILIGFTISVYVFYPLIIQSSFSLLNCINLSSDTSDEYLFVAPNMKCWDGQHSGYIFSVFLPGIIIFGLLFPLFLYNVLRLGKKYKARSQTVQEKIDQLRGTGSPYDRLKIIYFIILDEELFRFFYDGYKERLFFWEIVIFSKKFLLTMCSSLNQLIRPQTKNILILIILFFHFSLSLRYQPFKDIKANRLDQSSLFSTFVTSMCMIFIGAITDSGGRSFFGVITIIINVFFVSLLFYYIIHYLRMRRRMVKLAPQAKTEKVQGGILKKKD